jgi:hypothetical protein
MMNKIERLEDRIRRNKREIKNLKNILVNTEDEYEAENLAEDILLRQLIVTEARKELDKIMMGCGYASYDDYLASECA